MDFDRLRINEACLVSKIIETLGIPASAAEIAQCINICECVAALYRKEMAIAQEESSRHA